MVETTPLQRVVNLAGPVRGDNDNRRRLGDDWAEFGNRDLPFRQDFQKIGLKRLVGAVQLVDQQNWRAAAVVTQRLEQRALDQIVSGKQVRTRQHALPGRLNLHHLPCIVPLIGGRGDVQPLIALQADQPPSQQACERLCDLGLTNARLALEEQRALLAKCKEQADGKPVRQHIIMIRHNGAKAVYRIRDHHYFLQRCRAHAQKLSRRTLM